METHMETTLKNITDNHRETLEHGRKKCRDKLPQQGPKMQTVQTVKIAGTIHDPDF